MSRSYPISIGSIGSIGLCPLISGKSTPRDLYSMSSYSIDYDRSTNHTTTNFSDATIKQPALNNAHDTSYDSDQYSNAHSPMSKSAQSKVTRFSNIVKAYPPCDQSYIDSNYRDSIKNNSETYSSFETAILKSTYPIRVNNNDKIQLNGQRGILVNKSEIQNWKGSVPIEQYPINTDPNPHIIVKKDQKKLDYTQNIQIKYLKPPPPPTPGDLVIRHEANRQPPVAPPIIIRQQPPKPCNPPPLVIREAPPTPPLPVESRIIRISGKLLPPPPRKVIIERLPPIPSKPQPIIIERWLPYSQNVKRRVVFHKQPDPIYVKPRNVIVEWEAPDICIKKDFEHYGIVKANPCEYIQKYGDTLRHTKDLPRFAHECKPPKGLILASSPLSTANSKRKVVYELIGDIDALKLIDLEREGLGEYKSLIKSQSKINCKNSCNTSTSSFNKSSISVAVSSTCVNPIKNSSSSRQLCSSKSKTCLTFRQC